VRVEDLKITGLGLHEPFDVAVTTTMSGIDHPSIPSSARNHRASPRSIIVVPPLVSWLPNDADLPIPFACGVCPRFLIASLPMKPCQYHDAVGAYPYPGIFLMQRQTLTTRYLIDNDMQSGVTGAFEITAGNVSVLSILSSFYCFHLPSPVLTATELSTGYFEA
jgi:hypothetical protein